jgi:poly(3-hydroxybutyrate) depolymerase
MMGVLMPKRALIMAVFLVACALLWWRRTHTVALIHPSTPVPLAVSDVRVSKTRASIKVGDEIRDYVLSRPATLEPGVNYPLLIAFHCYRGDVKAWFH